MEAELRIIKLNISGRIFEVPEHILVVSGLFAGMIEDVIDIGINTPIVLYRSPLAFEEMLAYMYSPKYIYPARFDVEADFYLMPKIVRVPKAVIPGPKEPKYNQGYRSEQGQRAQYSCNGTTRSCSGANYSCCK